MTAVSSPAASTAPVAQSGMAAGSQNGVADSGLEAAFAFLLSQAEPALEPALPEQEGLAITSLEAGLLPPDVSPEAAWAESVQAGLAVAVGEDEVAVAGEADDFSLLGQTQQLDQRADRALRDGSAVWPHLAQAEGMGTTLAGAQASGWARSGLLTASMGVGSPAQQAATVWQTQGVALEETAQAMQDSVLQPDSQPLEAGERTGRVLLEGGWQMLGDTPPSPQWQRLTGPVEQWAAQWLGASAQAAGGQRPATPAVASRPEEQAHTYAVAGGGSGLRLTEQAVQTLTAPQSTGAEQAQEQARQEDLRFWLQGQQQRAELVLQRDGQAVRVQVQLRGQEAQVVFRSNQAETREQLDAGLEQLRDLLAQQGLELAEASVQADAGAQQGFAAPASWGQGQQGRVLAPTPGEAGLSSDLPAGARQYAGNLNIYV